MAKPFFSTVTNGDTPVLVTLKASISNTMQRIKFPRPDSKSRRCLDSENTVFVGVILKCVSANLI